MPNKHMHLSTLCKLRQFNRSISDKYVTSLNKDYRIFDGEKILIVTNISESKAKYRIQLHDYVTSVIELELICYSSKEIVEKLKEIVPNMQTKQKTIK
jgi:hypothetical protein